MKPDSVEYNAQLQQIMDYAKQVNETLYFVHVIFTDNTWKNIPVILCAAAHILKMHNKDYPGGMYHVPEELSFLVLELSTMQIVVKNFEYE